MPALLAAVLVVASVTDKLADFATNVVGDLGLPGIFMLMVPESACIPIPSEATVLFAGFNVSDGKYPLWAAVLVACVGNLIGSTIAYWVGAYGRTELLERRRFVHMSPAQLERADRVFERYGAWAVFFSRMLPVIRTFISLPAGIARMPFGRFALFTFLGSIPWNLALCLIGRAARDNWTEWRDDLHYVDYAMAVALVAAVVYGVVRWRRTRRGRPATDVA